MKNPLTKLIPLLAVLAAVLPAGIQPAQAQYTSQTGPDSMYQKTTYTYKTVGTLEIKLDVYRPSGEKILPVIFWIHGGALIMGSRQGIAKEQLAAYIRAGYAVVSIDYRLAPETKLEEIIEDLQDAYAWVRSQGPEKCRIDPERIAVAGHSAGGYLTQMAGVCLEPKPDALVSFYGYGDITGPWYSKPDSFYNLSPKVSAELAYGAVGDSVVSTTAGGPSGRQRGQFYLYCRQHGLWPREVAGHDPASELAWFKAYEPLRNVTRAYPPIILLHGQKDTDVPFEQSVLMDEELTRRGVVHEFVTNPDWGHGFDSAGLKDPAVREAFDRVLAFLKEHVR
ncbi:MAG: alpha/beta hydrolase [Candidatus Glassbacteria bacterium]